MNLFCKVIPEFILNKKNQYRLDLFNKVPGVLSGIPGKIEDEISLVVVFSHFITRRRKEGQQDFVGRKEFTEGLDNRTTLFEFPQ